MRRSTHAKATVPATADGALSGIDRPQRLEQAQLAANNNFRQILASMIGGEVARCSSVILQVAREVAKENLWTTESCISRSKATLTVGIIGCHA
jgi:hypothetical protein